MQIPPPARVELRVAGQDFRVKRRQGDVVVGQRQAAIGGKKAIRRLIKLRVEAIRFLRNFHVQSCGDCSPLARGMTAELMPRANPPLRAVVTTLPTLLPLVTPPAVPTPQLAVARQIVASVSTPEPLPAPAARGVTVPRDDVEPLTADLRRLHVTVSRSS